jgi:hypothetical protein
MPRTGVTEPYLDIDTYIMEAVKFLAVAFIKGISERFPHFYFTPVFC